MKQISLWIVQVINRTINSRKILFQIYTIRINIWICHHFRCCSEILSLLILSIDSSPRIFVDKVSKKKTKKETHLETRSVWPLCTEQCNFIYDFCWTWKKIKIYSNDESMAFMINQVSKIFLLLLLLLLLLSCNEYSLEKIEKKEKEIFWRKTFHIFKEIIRFQLSYQL